jgi:small nuclear ribonucleoprotein
LSSSSPSQQQPKRPLSTLQRFINRKVAVRLKSEIEYRGRMSNVDSYMNLILMDAEEYNGPDVIANYGKVVIIVNYVLFIKLVKEF